jgi:predicted amidophosphoribosyltransferase
MKCSVCGKTVNAEYKYCPHCGSHLNGSEQLRAVIDESFEVLEEVVKGDTMLRLENISNRLVSMEKELDKFLLTAK